MILLASSARSGVPVWFFGILAIAILIPAGITYGVLTSRSELTADTDIVLPVCLTVFPGKIRSWVGSDLPAPSAPKEHMEPHFVDGFLSRRYINTTVDAWADVYAVYCSSQPAGILGHQARVCYPAHGWIHDGSEPSQLTSRTGQQVRCLIHRFHKPAPAYGQTVVLNFYVLNGQITANEKDFSGLLGRRPNISGDPARYVAQVQISSVLENSIRTAAAEMADKIPDFLLDKDGKVKAAEFIQISGGSNVKSELSGNN